MPALSETTGKDEAALTELVNVPSTPYSSPTTIPERGVIIKSLIYREEPLP